MNLRHRHGRPARRRRRRADVRGHARPSSPRYDEASWPRRRSRRSTGPRSSSCCRRPCATWPPTSSRDARAAGTRWRRSATRSSNSGFYDATPDTPPGHSYGRIAAMLEDPTRVVGFEEQYAAAAAVMAQVAGLPVRVVVGYSCPPTRGATARPRSRRTTSRRGSSSTPASSAGSPSTSRPIARACRTPRRRARRPRRSPSPTRRRRRRRRRTSSRRARRTRRSTTSRAGADPLRRRPARAVGARRGRRRRRADRCCSCSSPPSSSAGRCCAAGAGGTRPSTDRPHRRRVGRGHRPLHRGRRAAASST